MIRTYLKEEKVLTKRDACRFLINAWEKLLPEEIRESFNYLTLEERWETANYFDLKIMHTVKYNTSSKEQKKKLIFEELLSQSPKDDNGNIIMKMVIDSFGSNDLASLDHISNYTKERTFFENEDEFMSAVEKAISILASYKIINKVEYRLIPTFKKLF